MGKLVKGQVTVIGGLLAATLLVVYLAIALPLLAPKPVRIEPLKPINLERLLNTLCESGAIEHWALTGDSRPVEDLLNLYLPPLTYYNLTVKWSGGWRCICNIPESASVVASAKCLYTSPMGEEAFFEVTLEVAM